MKITERLAIYSEPLVFISETSNKCYIHVHLAMVRSFIIFDYRYSYVDFFF